MEDKEKDPVVQEVPSKSVSEQVQDEFRALMINSTVVGSTGALWGGVLATYRGQSLSFYATSVGLNFGLAALTFFGTETMIRRARGNTYDAWGCTAAGGVTGLAMTIPIGGRYRAALAGLTMSGIGLGGFYAHRMARNYLDALGRERLRQRALESQAKKEDSNLDRGFAATRGRR